MTGINGPLFISQDRRSDLPAFLQHTVDVAATEYKKKFTVDALSHIQDFMHASNHDLINWKELTCDHMTQAFWGPFATYAGKYASNKIKVKFLCKFISFEEECEKLNKKDRFFSK